MTQSWNPFETDHVITRGRKNLDGEDVGKREMKKMFCHKATVCFKDCGLHNQIIDLIILFARLAGWLHSSPVEIWKKKIKERSLKKMFGLMLGLVWMLACTCTRIVAPLSAHTIPRAIAHASAFTRATILGTLCKCFFSPHSSTCFRLWWDLELPKQQTIFSAIWKLRFLKRQRRRG